MAYDAFISYNHTADRHLAEALQRGLYRFAAPFPGWRAVSLFRDETNLSASPGLWPTIERALDASAWFVLLASPEAAASIWVAREISWWLEHKGADRLLIVQTGGRLVWSERDGDFDWSATTALPRSLAGVFAHEPNITLLEDLSPGDLDLRNERFRSAVRKLSAAIRDRPPESLDGDHVRARRRVRAIAAAGALLVAAAATYGWRQARIAGERGTLAETRERQASAGRLSAASRTALATRADRALLLAVAAVGLDPGTEEVSALYAALAAHPQLDVFLRLEEEPVRAVAMSGNGKYVAVIDDGNDVWLRDASTGASVSLLIAGRGDESEAKARAVALAPDGTLAATGQDDGAVRVWRAATGDPIGEGLQADGPAIALAFDPKGGRLAAAGEGGDLRAWDVGSRRLVLAVHPPASFGVASVAFDATGRWLAAWSADGAMAVWDAATGRPLSASQVPTATRWHGHWDRKTMLAATVAAFPGGITVGAVNGDGSRLVTGGDDGSVVVWTTAKRTPLREELEDAQSEVNEIGFSSDGQSIAAVGPSAFIRWGLRSRRREKLFWVDHGGGTELRVAGDTLYLVGRLVSGKGLAVMRDSGSSPSTSPRTDIPAGPDATATLSTDGRLAVVIDEERATLWDLTQKRSVTEVPAPGRSGVAIAAFSADGKLLAVGDRDGLVLVWEIAGRRTVAGPLDAHDRDVVRKEFGDIVTNQTRVTTLAFDAAGTRLFAATGDDVSRVWDLRDPMPTGSQLPIAAGLDASGEPLMAVTRAAFSPDGGRLVVLVEGRAMLFDVASLTPLVEALDTGVTAIAFSPDGAWLVVGGRTGSVSLIDLALDSWVRRACAIANRSLTEDEWRQAGGEGAAPGCGR